MPSSSDDDLSIPSSESDRSRSPPPTRAPASDRTTSPPPTKAQAAERSRSPPPQGADAAGPSDRGAREAARVPVAARLRSTVTVASRGDGSARPRSPPPAAAVKPPAERKEGEARKERKEKTLVPGKGGTYIPPHRLKQLLAEAAQDKASEQYQRMMWEALRKSINGVVNKVNAGNIRAVLPELFRENLDRGRGLLCQSLMKAQAASTAFTPVFTTVVAVINTKFPDIGLLLCSRVLQQYKLAFRRNDKPLCITSLEFIAHLVNQRVVGEQVAFEVRV